MGLELGCHESDSGSLIDAPTVGKGHTETHASDWCSDGRFRYQLKCISTNGNGEWEWECIKSEMYTLTIEVPKLIVYMCTCILIS